MVSSVEVILFEPKTIDNDSPFNGSELLKREP